MESRIQGKATSFAKVHCIHAYTPMFYHHFEVSPPPDCFKHDNSENKILSLESFSFFDNIVVVVLFVFFYLEFQVVGHLMKKQPEGH